MLKVWGDRIGRINFATWEREFFFGIMIIIHILMLTIPVGLIIMIMIL